MAATRRLLLAGAASLVARPAWAQLTDILTAPKTLIDRAIEARSSGDIVRDNEVVLKVNRVMADLGTIDASTQIYEQRLLVTGIFDDQKTYDKFEKGVRAVSGIKKLYWHVLYMSKADQKKDHLLDWSSVTLMSTKAQARLVGTAGIADVNYRIAADSFATVYLLGRARSSSEHDKAITRARDGEGVRKLVDYVEVRP